MFQYITEVPFALIGIAVIPAIILLRYAYKKDKLEKEPARLLWKLILNGILVTFVAAAVEGIGMYVLSIFLDENSVLFRLIFYFLVVALCEEGVKFWRLKKKTWNNEAFNCRFDGIVYSIFVSLGFALWENIGYVVNFGYETALIRAVTAIPGHACFGVYMGLFYGLAKQYSMSGNRTKVKEYLKYSLWVSVLLHGCYDFFATSGSAILSIVFFLFVIALFIASLKLIKKASAEDRYLIDSNGLSDNI